MKRRKRQDFGGIWACDNRKLGEKKCQRGQRELIFLGEYWYFIIMQGFGSKTVHYYQIPPCQLSNSKELPNKQFSHTIGKTPDLRACGNTGSFNKSQRRNFL